MGETVRRQSPRHAAGGVAAQRAVEGVAVTGKNAEEGAGAAWVSVHARRSRSSGTKPARPFSELKDRAVVSCGNEEESGGLWTERSAAETSEDTHICCRLLQSLASLSPDELTCETSPAVSEFAGVRVSVGAWARQQYSGALYTTSWVGS